MESPPRAEVRQWLVEARLPAPVQQNLERLASSEDVRRVVVLPDVHLGRLVNNGCVAATLELVYPQAVGGDIGCGFSLIGFNASAGCLKDDHVAETVIGRIRRRVPALKQPAAQTLPPKLTQLALSDPALLRASQRDGAYQLGTLGCGNHFIEFQEDDAGGLWLMVHSGSRAMGQVISEFHLAKATPCATGLKYLDTHSVAGRAYLNDMQWALHYATYNRLAALARMVEALNDDLGITANEDSYLDSPHNFARREAHGGVEFIVHRKSANSARLGELNVIAGTMGSPSYLVHGLGAKDSFCSSSHGAGRTMSRSEARQQINPADLRRQLAGVKHDGRQLRALCDEAPAAYRDIRQVMQAQRDLVRQHARLTPVLNFKYPDRRRDPPAS